DLDLLVRKAHLLIENENNNRSERLMNIVARFNAGKRLNLIQRGSYQRRVHLSGLRHNKQLSWHYSPFKHLTGSSPGTYFKAYMNEAINMKRKLTRKRLFSDNEDETPRKKIKNTPEKKSHNTDYGPKAEEPEDELMLKNEVEEVMNRLTVTEEEIYEIENHTRGQFGNPVFEQERRNRLTASMFGRVMKRKPQTPCHNLVKVCLKPTNFWSEATEYGIAKEKVALALFQSSTNLNVRESGLWIDVNNGFLGASPDGVIESDNALVEIQGQLNIAKKDTCFFVVYVSDQIELFIEEIKRDEQFWNKMLPVLTSFYKECVTPEIVRKNIDKGKRCKDPPYIQEAITAFQEKKQ
ncbi:hypothetical protein NQ315_008812, partial [Exocentrus adspersus]